MKHNRDDVVDAFCVCHPHDRGASIPCVYEHISPIVLLIVAVDSKVLFKGLLHACSNHTKLKVTAGQTLVRNPENRITLDNGQSVCDPFFMVDPIGQWTFRSRSWILIPTKFTIVLYEGDWLSSIVRVWWMDWLIRSKSSSIGGRRHKCQRFLPFPRTCNGAFLAVVD